MVTRNTAKLCLNRLYGKFASTYHDTETVIMTKDTLDSIQYLKEVLRITHLEEGLSLVTITKKPLTLKRDVKIEKRVIDKAFTKFKLSDSEKLTNMALAATITSHARLVLYNLYQEIDLIGGKLCYRDTDSVFA